VTVSYFAAVLTRKGGRWSGDETDLDDCESLDDLRNLLDDTAGEVRLLVIEQDDEYAAIVRFDDGADDARAFLSDGHSADAYPLAAVVAEELAEIGDDDEDGDTLLDEDTPPVRESAPFGDPTIVEDLGISATDLLAMCAHEGTLPVDVLVAVCEKAGCAELFEDLHG
jgi:putative tRNA adenosine deaminase-associated protein